ncbi:MAG: AAA family ATPase [Micrococcales bacterium]|nr:AAA family ATPase [Micrococcales bacterium]
MDDCLDKHTDARIPGYRTRVVDSQIKYLLSLFGGLLIEGPKWCGKTWAGLRHSQAAVFVDEPTIRQQAELRPKQLLAGPKPLLVDEWQDAPVLRDTARRVIDFEPGPGKFIFTGSAVPPNSANRHSGTGRFARIRMRPMSLFEQGRSTGSVSLADLFKGHLIDEDSPLSTMDYEKAITLICRG